MNKQIIVGYRSTEIQKIREVPPSVEYDVEFKL